MSLALRFSLGDIEGLQARLARLGGADMTGLLVAIGAEVEAQTRRRIAEEKTSPDGKAWPEWSPTHAATRHGGHSLLMGDGNLLDSIQYEVNGDQVEVGSNMIYAAVMNLGARQGEFGRTSRNGPIPWGDIPAREFLGLSGENIEDLVQVANDWLDDQMGAA